VSSVVSCPNCEKKLAVKDEHKGRALICPQCKGRFTVPAGDAPAGGLLDLLESEASAVGDMGFLDGLGPAAAGPAKNSGAASASVYSAARPANGKAIRSPVAVGAASRVAAGRARKQADQMKMIYIGGGIAATVVLVIIVAAAIMNGIGGGGAGSGANEPEDIRFGLPERTRIQLFQKLVSAVDERGISKSCKEEWYRLADESKLDRSNIKDLLDEGFSFKNKKWELPAATSTAKNRALRMDWVRQRTNGPDPVLSQ
jgi:hypothetical protein